MQMNEISLGLEHSHHPLGHTAVIPELLMRRFINGRPLSGLLLDL